MKAVEALQRVLVLPAAAAPSALQEPELKRRGLRLGNLGLLVEHDRAGEILEHAAPQPLPRTAAWCCGLIGLRGRLLPAFDLHRYFGLSRSSDAQQWWLALDAGENSVAFVVDALPQVLRLKSKD